MAFNDARDSDEPTQISVEASEGFVLTPAVAEIAQRALAYLRAGYAVHLCGPTGTGKTTLAFHVGSQLNRPIALLHGDHQLTSTDLIGSPSGTRTSRVVDNYIRSVVRTEEERRELWVDNRLTTACRYGHTLIYDEFNRTTAEANNPLLSVFSERILNLPKASDGRESYIRVHPKFAAILTSNPEEYAGVFRAPDALLDRVITITLDYYDDDTETHIVAARAGVELEFAHSIVQLIRALRREMTSNNRPTIRAAVTIAKVLRMSGLTLADNHPFVRSIFMDVVGVDPFARADFDAGVERVIESPAPVASDVDANADAQPALPNAEPPQSEPLDVPKPQTQAFARSEPDLPEAVHDAVVETQDSEPAALEQALDGAALFPATANAASAEDDSAAKKPAPGKRKEQGSQSASAWLTAFDQRGNGNQRR